jgi:hypothetical protein
VVRDGIRTRLADSVETALKWGSNRIVILRERERQTVQPVKALDGCPSNLQLGKMQGWCSA